MHCRFIFLLQTRKQTPTQHEAQSTGIDNDRQPCISLLQQTSLLCTIAIALSSSSQHDTTQHNTVLRTRYRNPRHAFAGRPRPEASRTYHSQTTSIPNFNPQSDSCREPQALISITIFRKNARAFFLRTSFAIKTSCITNRTPALSAQQYQAAIFCYRRPILSRCT